eukprot:TRINITY_DN25457_c0_g1_i1.p1 TRINITY_DN25457_c0_g1~~TRINITY_DN25457_c0_g1_i1.p1  ORF type:complete len:263 (+),score=21.38 TRINITY_DN25457_c0_g1_i1:68-790(+)
MSRLAIFALLCAFAHTAYCAARPEANPDYPPKGVTQQTSYKRYDWVEVEMHFYNNFTGHHQKAMFYPRMDEFSRLQVNGTCPILMTNPHMYIWMTVHGMSTTWKHVWAENTERLLIMGYFSAVVQLTSGVPTAIQWDDGCQNCLDPDKHCLDNSCGVDYSKINCNAEGVDCNAKVYLAWAGVDSEAYPCKSTNSLPSAFSKYSATTIANFGIGTYDTFIYRVKDTNQVPLPGSDRGGQTV